MVLWVIIMSKKHRWISVLVSAKEHKGLAVLALDEGITLAELLKTAVREFLKERGYDSTKS